MYSSIFCETTLYLHFQSCFFISWIKKRNQSDSRMFKATQNCHLPSHYPMQTPSAMKICNFTLILNLFYMCRKTLTYFYHRFALKLDSLHTSSLPKSLLHRISRSRKHMDAILTGDECWEHTRCFTHSSVKWAAQGSCCNLINAMLETAHP